MSVGGFFALNKTKDSHERFSAVDSYMTKRVQSTSIMLLFFLHKNSRSTNGLLKFKKAFLRLLKNTILLHLNLRSGFDRCVLWAKFAMTEPRYISIQTAHLLTVTGAKLSQISHPLSILKSCFSASGSASKKLCYCF